MPTIKEVIQDSAQAEPLARIRIPTSATNFHCIFEDHGPDQVVYGRFDVPEADLPQVLQGMPEDVRVGPNGEHSSIMSYKIDESWWNPDELQSSQGVGWIQEGPFSVSLLFGKTSESGVLTVYFFNSST